MIDVLYIDAIKDNAYSLYDLPGHALAHGSLSGVIKYTILVDPSLVVITIHLVCLIHVWE